MNMRTCELVPYVVAVVPLCDVFVLHTLSQLEKTVHCNLYKHHVWSFPIGSLKKKKKKKKTRRRKKEKRRRRRGGGEEDE